MNLKTEVVSTTLELLKHNLEKHLDEKEVSRYDMERYAAQIAIDTFKHLAEAL